MKNEVLHFRESAGRFMKQLLKLRISRPPGRFHTRTNEKRPADNKRVNTAYFEDTNGRLLDRPDVSNRRIEICGDSISCGYGNEGLPQSGFVPSEENNYMAYGSITARALDADCHTIAWSGKGVSQNYDCSTTDLLPDLYTRTLAGVPESKWDFSQWTPHAVIICLGENDYSEENYPVDEERFVDAYFAFINQIRTLYNGVVVFCVSSPIGGCPDSVYGRIVSRFKYNVYLVKTPCIKNISGGIGGDGHPSVQADQLIARVLIQEIKSKLGW